jgi:hypothetical protein
VLANAYNDLTKIGYYGEHLRAIKEAKGTTWPRMERLLASRGITNEDGKPVTENQLKQWAAGNVRMQPWLLDGLIASYGLDSDFFDKPVDDSVRIPEFDDTVDSRHTSALPKEPDDPLFRKVRLIYLREDSMLRQILETPSLPTIRVPNWIREPDLYAARVDDDVFHPLAERGDVQAKRTGIRGPDSQEGGQNVPLRPRPTWATARQRLP